ncbi:hypothetical protein C8255_23285 [filamentous cyanobacterium CCP3]|nr:hypothetical protein C8255_23285 [filamentous cyanobacterium CCP3]
MFKFQSQFPAEETPVTGPPSVLRLSLEPVHRLTAYCVEIEPMVRRLREPQTPDFGALINFLDTPECRGRLKGRAGYDDRYPHLLSTVAGFSDSDDADDLVALAHMAYGWMPTSLERCKTDGWGVPKSKVLSRIRACGSAAAAVEFLGGMGSNAPLSGGSSSSASWIGTSKALHFVNPKIFPIWDEKVASHYGCSAAKAREQRTKYEEYLVHLHESLPAHGRRACLLAQNVLGYKVTGIRALEKVLFATNLR